MEKCKLNITKFNNRIEDYTVNFTQKEDSLINKVTHKLSVKRKVVITDKNDTLIRIYEKDNGKLSI